MCVDAGAEVLVSLAGFYFNSTCVGRVLLEPPRGGYAVPYMSVPARWIDLAVIVAYLGGITWFGAQFRSSQHTLRHYFLGGTSAPWWAVPLLIV